MSAVFAWLCGKPKTVLVSELEKIEDSELIYPGWSRSLVVCGNQNFGSFSVFKKPNRILFVKPYFTVTAVLYKTASDNNGSKFQVI